MIYSILHLIRIRHWIKNFFILVPYFFSPFLWHKVDYNILIYGFFSFSFMASCIYIINDICDCEKDQMHPKKKHRPIASGKISPFSAYVLIGVLICFIYLLTYQLPTFFLYHLFAYGIINVIYCFITKNIALIDVFSIASGFVLRMSAGAILIAADISGWLILCTGFISLFLAFAKRRDDVINLMDIKHRSALKGYNQDFLDVLCTICLTCVIICYVLYTRDPANNIYFSGNLYLTIPFVLLGTFRYLQIIYVDKASGDPTYVVTTDKTILFSLFSWVLTIIFIFYF